MLFCLSSDPPIIEPTQTLFEVNVSESVTFMCNPKPYPRVTNLVWEKEIDGEVTYIHTGHMSTSLTLTNLNMEDSGIYRCVANNSAGSTNMSFTLQVTTGNVQYSTVKCSGNCSNWFKAGPAFTLDVLQYLLSAILPFYIILFLFYHTFIK